MVMIDMKTNTLLSLLLITSMLFACTPEEVTVCRNDPPGFLITNVSIIDGLGTPAVAGAVRINDGLIADIGELQQCEGETVIDGGGQTLAPGFIDTDMTRVLGDDQRDAMLARVPLGRLGEAREIADAVVYLASDAAAYITGETLHVNGGMLMD